MADFPSDMAGVVATVVDKDVSSQTLRALQDLLAGYYIRAGDWKGNSKRCVLKFF
jgi:hypothetical protein